MTRKQYGRAIRRRRKALGLSARAAARAAGISHVYYNAIEAGSLPSQEIAEAVGVALLDVATCCGVWFDVAIAEAKNNADDLRDARKKWEASAEN